MKKYSDKKALKMIRKDLEKELHIIRFYEQNLHLFKTAKSRNAVKSLVIASLSHAERFVKAFHELQPSARKETDKERRNALITLGYGMREEKGAEDIYKYQAARMNSSSARKTLLAIAKEERQHQKIVKKTASEMFTGLPKEKKIKKKYNL